ncbi:MAG TPA: hypothetical protein VHM20_03315 [Gammaproteobacteria bacterium]|jgi:opacity protein-like surface antigen|nr:hypothetical protein [Gammaproteobacteria bacterium]
MKQYQFFWIGIFLLLFHLSSFADYKNESFKKMSAPCLFQCVLNDGFYLGVAAGYDIYQMSTKTAVDNTFFAGDFAFSANPTLNAEGIVGGAYFGYGKYFPSFHHTYLGIEAFGYGSAAMSDYLLQSPNSSYETNVKGKNNFGLSIIPGIKFVSSTLLYVKLGYLASKINVDEIFTNDGVIIDDNQENPMVYGWNIGFGIENAFFDDFSLRAEYNYQLYNSFKTEAGTKINPNNGEFMLGLSYRIIL